MTRTIAGITWHIHSPSLYELVSDRIERVYLMYEAPTWLLIYKAADGHTVSRLFNSRDEATALLGERASA